MLLVCGLGGLGRFWDPVMTRLAGAYRLIAFDHPGVGESGPVPEQRVEGIVDACLDILDDAGIEQAHIVGHSTGGLVAQAMALDHGERAGRIVLSATWAFADRRFRDLMEFRKRVLQRMGLAEYQRLGELLAHPSPFYKADSAPSPGGTEDPGHHQVIADRIDMLLGYHRQEDLARITHPTLVIGAGDDWLVPFQHSEELAGSIPGAQLRELSGGHFTPKVRPAEYAEILGDFLA